MYRDFHSDGNWEFRTEVKLSNRRCDAIARHNPSGFTVAYEIKIDTFDLRSDIRNPEKRKPAMRASNEFYYVAPWRVAKNVNIPRDCGLIVRLDDSSLIMRQAARRA